MIQLHKIECAHLHCVTNHYAKFEYKGMNIFGTLVNVKATVVATTGWWWQFPALVMAQKIKKTTPFDFMI